MTDDTTTAADIQTYAFRNRPPLRVDKNKVVTLEYWRGGAYGCEGGGIEAVPCSTGGYHVWYERWSNVDPTYHHRLYAGVIETGDGARKLLLSILGNDPDYERYAEAAGTLRSLGIDIIEEA